MKTYRCIVIDDEPGAHLVLQHYIDRVPFLECAAYFFNAVAARSFLLENEVDVLFVDINMPEFDGLSLLRTLPQPQKAIITSAYSEYAIEGFELEVVDYLLKPFRFERFLKALNKLEKNGELAAAAPQTIEVRSEGVLYQLEVAAIRFIQSKGNYLRIQLATNALMVHGTTTEMEERLRGTSIIRSHKSFMVNRAFISLQNNILWVDNRWKIPIGKTYKKYLLSGLNRTT